MVAWGARCMTRVGFSGEGSVGRCGSSLCIGYLVGGRTGGGEGCVFVVIYLLICLCICILVSFCK